LSCSCLRDRSAFSFFFNFLLAEFTSLTAAARMSMP
jgi:hypothetical protein